MTADEIRAECKSNIEQLNQQCIDNESGMGPEMGMQILLYAAQMEMAAQLAELNARLSKKFSLEVMD